MKYLCCKCGANVDVANIVLFAKSINSELISQGIHCENCVDEICLKPPAGIKRILVQPCDPSKRCFHMIL